MYPGIFLGTYCIKSNLMCSLSLPVAGPDYVKQQLKEPVEIKEVPVEKKESPRDSPHFYRKGTTPPHSPMTSPVVTPPPSPRSSKKKGQTAHSNASRKTSKEEKPHCKTSKEEKISHKNSKDEHPSKKHSKEEKLPVIDVPQVHVKAPAKPAKLQQSTAASFPPSHLPMLPVNGELHSEYHSYYIKAPTKVPPPPDPEEDVEEEPNAQALARMPPQPLKPLGTPIAKPSVPESKSDQKLRKQDSLKPKSLADTKKASMEIVENSEERVNSWPRSPLFTVYAFDTVILLSFKNVSRERLQCYITYITPNLFFLPFLQGPNSILVAMVMLLNIGLAIIFVHFLT